MSIKHSRADVYRAILESVAFGIRHNIEMMKAEGVEAKRILAVGGGTKNLPWMQMVSDIANISMLIPEQQIGASYGDAFMAAVGIGAYENLSQITEWIKIKNEITPTTEADKQYTLNYKIFRELYKQTAPLMHELSHAQRKNN